MLRVPVLTYHSTRTSGTDHGSNDHIALRDDLRTIHSLGMRVVPLEWVVDWNLGTRTDDDLEGAVAISFDDGARHDFVDYEHVHTGFQRSFFNILRDFREEFGPDAQPDLHATSFVIASPEARTRLDQTCLRGLGWWGDEWWHEANESGLFSIHNHSWDHNHPTLDKVCQARQIKGRFDVIDSYEDCAIQVTRAAEYISGVTGPHWPDLFAYPWGQSSDYLRCVYFPQHAEEHRTRAAFGADGNYVTPSSSRWNLPRFVCGSDWHDADGLRNILTGSRC